MAGLDYSVIVLKNGKLINKTDADNMLKMVGWEDVPQIRYEDCDHTIDLFGQGLPEDYYSHCYNCPRAKAQGQDCRGKNLLDPNQARGQYFAYIGNEKVTVGFYRYRCSVFVDGELVDSFFGLKSGCCVLRREYAGVPIVIRDIDAQRCCFHLETKIDGDFYHVIYGYGIDANMEVWNQTKVIYLGKRLSRAVDKLIARFWKR